MSGGQSVLHVHATGAGESACCLPAMYVWDCSRLLGKEPIVGGTSIHLTAAIPARPASFCQICQVGRRIGFSMSPPLWLPVNAGIVRGFVSSENRLTWCVFEMSICNPRQATHDSSLGGICRQIRPDPWRPQTAISLNNQSIDKFSLRHRFTYYAIT